ncbi:MAG TPA: NADH-quinone oxidoreductase subunit NuoE [Anaerolineales bacterium]|nr:NADH-quinone oxidoreductase subunit NuoE [Anaerolineales bacterium]
MLADKYADEIRSLLEKYPAERTRSAVMPLLHLAQREYGYITRAALEEVAELCGTTPTEVGTVAGFYTLYHAQPAGRHTLQVCTDLPCALHGGEELAKKLCANLGVRLGEVTPDGLFMVEEVMCLAGCDKAPVLQVQDAQGIHYHENQSEASAGQLIEELRRASKEPKA